MSYDALIVVSFGGPERPEDVMPFLETVTRGRNVPRERLEQVARQYMMFGGVSPINEQNRALIAALERELAAHGPPLPVYFGNRNWHPFFTDAIRTMAADGIRSALAFITSPYSSYFSCRQYLEDIERARQEVGAAAPRIERLRPFWNHPGFVEPMAENVRRALAEIPVERRDATRLLFTAHSIPAEMAEHCDYQAQLLDTAELIAERLPAALPWDLVFQSRSGPPSQPWLEPDINDHLRALHARGVADVIVAPIGFLSDHMEVKHDLDTVARNSAQSIGIHMVRAATVGIAPPFIAMIRELIRERTENLAPRALGRLGPRRVPCPPECCV